MRDLQFFGQVQRGAQKVTVTYFRTLGLRG